MADFSLIREEGDGHARVLTIRLSERDWHSEQGQVVRVEVLSNVIIPPEDRV